MDNFGEMCKSQEIFAIFLENGEELLSTLDSEEELTEVYDLFMELLFADEEDGGEGTYFSWEAPGSGTRQNGRKSAPQKPCEPCYNLHITGDELEGRRADAGEVPPRRRRCLRRRPGVAERLLQRLRPAEAV